MSSQKTKCLFRQKGILKAVALVVGIACFTGSFAQNDSISIQKKEKVLAGKTQGQMPFLKFGPGTDRLGGAKMTYLDTAIVLQVVDSLRDDYIVRLAPNHQAFIPKENMKLLSNFRRPDYYLTSSWSVYGDEKYDYVTIGLDERLPYQSIQMNNPSRIVVDIYGATGNTNWITQLKSAKEIKNVYYEQVEDNLFRVTIELKHAQHWGYSITYKKKALVVAVKRQPEHLSISHLKIAVDAGHGGTNSGATGVGSGIKEKELNLQIAKKLEKQLIRKGAEVFMTRNEDIDLSMIDRSLLLREANPDLLISIHNNAASNPNVKGVSTYYRYIGFRPLSLTVLDRLLDLELNNFGNIGSFNFSLNGPTEYPNCLVEVAFLSNEADEKLIMDQNFQSKVAKQIRRGINDWLRKAR
ncbi:MAG: N-acetylmuramoyl-L-alanine amidase [Bacteroidota bacterium]|nr:N-acetylmuramoyl-L-alanine amidase [Odoribacter sp.]MDP3644160.1 N-acetylmuramoyl-L-alanine amidase [Bacteroidota bacterium]